MSDWIETTDRLIQDDDFILAFSESNEYRDAFEEWASKNYPELYGND